MSETKTEIEQLRLQNEQLRLEIEKLQKTNERLHEKNEKLQEEKEVLEVAMSYSHPVCFEDYGKREFACSHLIDARLDTHEKVDENVDFDRFFEEECQERVVRLGIIKGLYYGACPFSDEAKAKFAAFCKEKDEVCYNMLIDLDPDLANPDL